MSFFKSKNNRIATFVCLLIAFLCLYAIQNESLYSHFTSRVERYKIGTVEEFQKDVRKRSISSYFWDAISGKDQVSYGDSVFTGKNSQVSIKLNSGQNIVISPNSLVKFSYRNKKLMLDIPYGEVKLTSLVEDIIVSDCGKSIALNKGDESVVFNKNDKCGSIKAQSPTGQLAKNIKLQQQEFKPAEQVFEEVATQGKLNNVEPSQLALDDSLMTLELPGEDPFVLLAPQIPNTELSYDLQKQQDKKLSWAPVKEAIAYEVELSETPDFAQSSKIKVKTASMPLSKVPTTSYYRVKALGKNSIESGFSDVGKVIVLYPPIKVGKDPIVKDYYAKNPSDKGGKGAFEIAWTEVPQAEKYIVEVRNQANKTKVGTFSSRSPASTIEVPNVGKYQYKVKAYDKKGRVISSSNVGKMVYNRVFGLLAPLVKKEMNEQFYFFQKQAGRFVWLNWEPQGEKGSFRVEVSKDPQFQEVIKSSMTNKKKILVTEMIPPGDYYWRVRSEAGEAYSDWSSTHSFKVQVGQ